MPRFRFVLWFGSKSRVTVGLAAACVLAACQGNPVVSMRGRGGSDGTAVEPPSGAGGSDGEGGSSGSSTPPVLPGGGIALPDAAPMDTTGAPEPTADANCGLQNYQLERRPAELMLLLDRSGSMKQPPMRGGLLSKWQEVTPALHETVMGTDSLVQWGLKFFPTETVCSVPDGVDVPPAMGNYAKIGPAITAATPEGMGTPTHYALDKLVAYFKATPSDNTRYIVVATDGEPNCADAMTDDLDDTEGAIMAVANAAAAGYKVYVVGIATTTSTTANDVLNRMADAGGTARMVAATEPRYYPVANKADLISSLKLITGKVIDCVFPLDKQPPSPNDVKVEVDGMRLTNNSAQASSWKYGAGNKSIEIAGAACDAIKMGMSKVAITFGCPGVAIP